MRISDWSSDVCSSDLQLQVGDAATGDRALVAAMRAFRLPAAKIPFADWPRQFWTLLLATPELREQPQAPSWGSGFGPLAGVGRGDRKSVVEGKSVSVRVDLGGRRLIKKKTTNNNNTTST